MQGKSWGNVAEAIRRNEASLTVIKVLREKAKANLTSALQELDFKEKKRIFNLEGW